MNAPARLPWLVTALFTLAVVTACSDPCVDLSEKVCRCERTEVEQRACIQRVNDEAGLRDTTTAQQDRCSELLDGCTCEALADGDLARCGLAYESEQQPRPAYLESSWEGQTDTEQRGVVE